MPSHIASHRQAGQSSQEAPDIGNLILRAPKQIWNQIREALQVEQRQEAVELVSNDPQARQIVTQILSGGAQGGSLAGGQPQPSRQAPAGRRSSLAGSARAPAGASAASSRRPTARGGASRVEF